MDRTGLIAALRQFIKYTKELNTNLVLDEKLGKQVDTAGALKSCAVFLTASNQAREHALLMIQALTNDDR